MKAIDLAKYVIETSNNSGKSIDSSKLQEMLYFIQGYTLKEINKPVLDDEILHWDCGPAIPEVCHFFKSYGMKPISINEKFDKPTYPVKGIVDKVIEKCGGHSSNDLANLTRSENPWIKTDNNEVISKESIRDLFSKSNPLDLDLTHLTIEMDEFQKLTKKIFEEDKRVFEALAK